ncbi:MAG: hypothetical protein OEY99_04025 [Aigarchaeota archaeon]|nr:hypothetical protein [Aigarchaeota archaeon]
MLGFVGSCRLLRCFLDRSITQFDKSHFNHFFWLAMVNKRRGNKEATIENCKQALAICKRDKKWPEEWMENIKAGIRRLMEDP